MDESSFSSTNVDYKFNHHGYKVGYDVTGDFFNHLVQRETIYDGKTRGYGDEWHLGYYDHTEGAVMHYLDGTYCNEIGENRRAHVIWSCGNQLEIIKMTEPETCFYRIFATKQCELGKSPEHLIGKYGARFNEYREMWLSGLPGFSSRMQTRIDRIGQTMLDYYQLNKDRFGYCHELDDDEEDADVGVTR